MSRLMVVALTVGLSGCGGTEEGDGPTAAYLLMDSDIQSVPGRLEVGPERTPLLAVLPVAAEPEEGIALRAGAVRVPIAPRPGQLGWIHGPDGFVEWLTIGRDVLPDVLLVEGTEDAVSELAEMLAATREERGAGTWELRAQDLWERTGFVEPPEGILEARPSLRPMDGATQAVDDSAHTFAGLPGVAGAPVAGLVGVYASERGALVLDASGGFVLSRWDGAATAEDCGDASELLGQYTYDQGVIELRSPGASQRFVLHGSRLRGADGTVMKGLLDEASP